MDDRTHVELSRRVYCWLRRLRSVRRLSNSHVCGRELGEMAGINVVGARDVVGVRISESVFESWLILKDRQELEA